MRLLSILLVAAGAAAAAATYTAAPIGPVGGLFAANILGMNNKGEVLADVCKVAAVPFCQGPNRFSAVWSNGAFTPLPIPSGYSYVAQPAYYAINDSGTVVGTLGVLGGSNSTGLSHVFEWKNGVPSQLPDAPVPGACAGAGCICLTNGSSTSYGINAAGHILGSTIYYNRQPGGVPNCSSYWVYDGAKFRLLPYPEPLQCVHSPGGGTGLGFPSTFNDADVVLQTVQNFFCGPPFFNPAPPFPSSDPVLVQTNGSYSFLPVGALSGASGTSINDVGDVLGFWDSGTGRVDLLVWDNNGLHDLGPSGYGHMNNVGQVVYLTSSCLGCGGGVAMWQNGVSTPVTLPPGIFPTSNAYVPAALNDAGQIVVGTGSSGNNVYLLTPSGPCAQDVTSQVKIAPAGFRYNHSTGLFNLIGSVTNTSGAPIPGPISLVVDNLPASATLFNITGDTLCAAPQGSPYQDIGNIGAGQSLAPGASISGSIDFIDTAQTGITYRLRVLAGPGGR